MRTSIFILAAITSVTNKISIKPSVSQQIAPSNLLLATRRKLCTPLFPYILAICDPNSFFLDTSKKFKKIQKNTSVSHIFFSFLDHNLNPSLQDKNNPKMLCKNSEKKYMLFSMWNFSTKFFSKYFLHFFPKSYLCYKIAKMYGKGVCPISCVCPIKIAALWSFFFFFCCQDKPYLKYR
jgi:hypothetical protein